MTYDKTIWKNREVERPRTFRQQNNPDGTVTLIPEEGQIIEPGTPIIADNMNKIEDAIEELFTSVSNGKQVVADAITDKGVPTSATDTFQQMADNISDISTGEDTSDATATAGDILSGQTAYARGLKLTGTIPRRTGNVNAQSISRSGTSLRLRPQTGHYDGSTSNSVQITHPTIDPSNIKAGVNFAGSGLIGTLKEGTPTIFDNPSIEPVRFVLGYQDIANPPSISRAPTYVRLNFNGTGPGQTASMVTDTPINFSNCKYLLKTISIGPGDTSIDYIILSTEKMGDHNTYDWRTTINNDASNSVDLIKLPENLSGSYYLRIHRVQTSIGSLGAATTVYRLLTISNP